jgi:hypothetical protein
LVRDWTNPSKPPVFDIPSTAGGDSENTAASLIPMPAPNNAPATASADSEGSRRCDQSLSKMKLTPALLR